MKALSIRICLVLRREEQSYARLGVESRTSSGQISRSILVRSKSLCDSVLHFWRQNLVNSRACSRWQPFVHTYCSINSCSSLFVQSAIGAWRHGTRHVLDAYAIERVNERVAFCSDRKPLFTICCFSLITPIARLWRIVSFLFSKCWN